MAAKPALKSKTLSPSKTKKTVSINTDSTSTDDPRVVIMLDQQGPFFSGGKISGVVILDIKTERPTRGVIIHCHGDAKVAFLTPERHFVGSKRNKVNPIDHFSATEVFMDEWQYLLGGPKIKQHILSPGPHHQRMTFTFDLPKVLPASYSGKYGHIEYKIQVKVKGYGEGVKDQVTTAVFRVVTPVNLNNFHDTWKPLVVAAKEVKKTLGLRRGMIGFVLELPHTGIVVGDSVDFTGELVNTTKDWEVSGVELRIFQSHLFAADGEMTWFKNCIWETVYPGVNPGTISNWNGTIGPIPDKLLPSTLGGSHIIRISYWLQVCMTYRKPCSKKQFRLVEVGELFIGNVAFNEANMEKYHRENEKERQHHALRMGIRYRPSLDEILGQEPNLSYFANFSHQAKKPSLEDSDHDIFGMT